MYTMFNKLFQTEILIIFKRDNGVLRQWKATSTWQNGFEFNSLSV